MAKKEKWFKDPMIWISVVILVVIVWLVLPGGVREYDNFASCVSESGAVMYGTEWCSHCQAQKAMFGTSFDKIDFVDCDREKDRCLIAGVSGYPTWKIGGENYAGQQSLIRLASLTKCELSKD